MSSLTSLFRKSVIRNTTSGFMAQAVTTALGIFVTPFVIHTLGLRTYGLWVLVSSIVGYLGLTDLGLRPAIGRFVALHLAKNQTESINEVAVTAFGVLCGCGVLIVLAAVVVRMSILQCFHIDEMQIPTAQTLALVIGCTLAAGMPLAVFDAILVGFARYDLTYKLDIFGAVARSAATLILLISGFGVIALGVMNLVVLLCVGIGQIYLAHRVFPQLRMSPRKWSFSSARELYGLGIWSFVTTLWHRLAFMTDNVVVGWALDTKSVAIYSIAGRLVSYAQTGSEPLSAVFLPMASTLHVQKDNTGQKNLLLECTKGSVIYALFMAAVFVIYGPSLIRLWVGDSFSDSARVLLVLTPPLVSFIAVKPANIVLFAMGQSVYKWVAIIFWMDALANLILSVIFAKLWGMIGVAYGTLFSMVITTALILPLYTCRVCSMSYYQYLTRTYGQAYWLGLLLVAGLLGMKQLFPSTHLFMVGTILTVTAAVYFTSAYYIYFARYRHTTAPAVL